MFSGADDFKQRRKRGYKTRARGHNSSSAYARPRTTSEAQPRSIAADRRSLTKHELIGSAFLPLSRLFSMLARYHLLHYGSRIIFNTFPFLGSFWRWACLSVSGFVSHRRLLGISKVIPSWTKSGEDGDHATQQKMNGPSDVIFKGLTSRSFTPCIHTNGKGRHRQLV